mgnify:CR=1 FL=1
MTKLRCAHCGARFIPAPQVPNQAYCSKANCQKERRRQWQKSKLQSDPDYRDNQSRAQKAWTDRNPEYWSFSVIFEVQPPRSRLANAAPKISLRDTLIAFDSMFLIAFVQV